MTFFKDTYQKELEKNIELFKATYSSMVDDTGQPIKGVHPRLSEDENRLAVALLSVLSEAVARETVARSQAMGDLDIQVIDDIYRRLDSLGGMKSDF